MYKLVSVLVLCLGLGACDMGPKSAAGFRLPDGNPEKGEQLFVNLDCIACHTIHEKELPVPSEAGPVSLELGGVVHKVQTYGELVTSIINPSHKLTRKYPKETVSEDGQSLMRNYNDVMTIQQLIDLVAFLQGEYEVVPPPTPSIY